MNWDAVAALGQLGGIIVTAWAVIVSLKIARMTQETQKQLERESITPELKMNVNFHRDLVLPANHINKYTLFASAMNVKKFPVSIEFVNLYFENKNNAKENYFFATEDLIFSRPLPIVLQPGENIRLDFPLAYMIAKFYKENKTEDTIFFRVDFWDNHGTSYTVEQKIVIYYNGFTLKNKQYQKGCHLVLFPHWNKTNEYTVAIYGDVFNEYKDYALTHRSQLLEEKPGREINEFFIQRFL